MTVIAYKDRTLAGDSAMTDRGAIIALQSKLQRLPSGALYGASGDSDDRPLVAVLANVKTVEDIPSAAALRELRCDVLALLVLPDGTLCRIDTNKKSGMADIGLSEPQSVGSGADLAMGAMLAGKGAAEACAIAASRDIHCREPITTLSLDGPITGRKASILIMDDVEPQEAS